MENVMRRELASENVLRVAIIRLSSLGDIITTMVFLEAIYKRENAKGVKLEITWIVDSAFGAIMEHSPLVGEICKIPLRGSKKDKKLLIESFKKVRELGEFDIVIDLQGLLKSAIIGKILKSKIFVGYAWRGAREKLASVFYTKRVDIDYNEHILKRSWEVLSVAFGYDEKFSLDILDKRGVAFSHSNAAKKRVESLDIARKSVLFLLEASKMEKEYGVENFYQVAMGLKACGVDRIYLLWDKKEDEIKALGKRDEIFCVLPHLNFDEIKALLGKMSLVIGGDTGITHLSWALGVPSITLYGNTPIKRFRLDGERHVSICKFEQEVIVKGDLSIREIEPYRVVESAKKLIVTSPLGNHSADFENFNQDRPKSSLRLKFSKNSQSTTANARSLEVNENLESNDILGSSLRESEANEAIHNVESKIVESLQKRF